MTVSSQSTKTVVKIVQYTDAPVQLFLEDENGDLLDLSLSTGSELQFAVARSSVERTALVQVQEGSGLQKTVNPGEILVTFDGDQWRLLKPGVYAGQVYWKDNDYADYFSLHFEFVVLSSIVEHVE